MIAKKIFQVDDNNVICDPIWNLVHRELSQISKYNRIVLSKLGVGNLVAANGQGDHYIVTYFPYNEEQESLTLADPSLGDDSVDLIIEDVVGDYPARWCVGLAMLEKVFEYFLREDRLPSDACWEIANTGLQANLNKYF